MADTSYLKRVAEEVVRAALTIEYGTAFSSQILQLRTGGTHEFDAVSSDGRIVASIKCASGKTSSGRNPDGKIKNAIAELYYLGLASCDRRLLVLTSSEFHGILTKTLRGRLVPEIELKLVELPEDIAAQVLIVQAAASKEVRQVKAD